MFLQDEQNITNGSRNMEPIPKLQVSKLLQVPEVAEEKILKNLQRHRKINEVGGGYYWGLDKLCKPEQRTELAIWVLLQFIDQVDLGLTTQQLIPRRCTSSRKTPDMKLWFFMKAKNIR